MKNILEIDSVILNYGENRVLSNVYLKCEQGEIIGVLGRNGTGKTTLMRVIFGELDTTDKSLRINGNVVNEAYKIPNLISYLPQFNFIPKSFLLKQVFKKFKTDFDSFVQIFPDFKCFYKKRLNELSGGERRIVEIYSILTTDSKFCLLDEPFTHVMPVHVETIKQLIDDEKLKKGIVLIDHMYKNVIEICDSICIIEGGKTNLVKSEVDFKRFDYLATSDS